MFERSELQILRERINEPRRFIQVVSGPRQVGKTTIISQLYKKITIPALYESADAIPPGNTLWLDQLWDATRLRMKSQGSEEYLLIIDEVQNIPNWSETVKKN